MTRSKMMIAALAMAGLLTVSSAAQASLLAPGQTTTPADGTGSLTNDVLLATISGNGLVSQLGTFTIDYVSNVYRNTVTNGLDFTYLVTNHTESTASISATGHANFATNLVIDARYAPPGTFGGGTHSPSGTNRDDTPGTGITFSYSGTSSINPGQVSTLEIIMTNATNYTSGFYSVLAGGDSRAVRAFEPGVAVPEPATVLSLLVAAPVIGLGLARRRRTV
jgi:hypothetical protein